MPASESANLLGRLISHYQDPTLDYTPELPSATLTPATFQKFLQGVQYDDAAHFTAQTSRDDRVWAKMLGLLSLSSTSAEGGTTEVVSPRIIIRRIKLEADYFKALKDIPDARGKILEMCTVGGKAYLVVGTMSIQTATFKRTGMRRNDTDVSGSLPVGAAAGAAAASAGLPLPPDAVPNAEMGVQRSNSSDWTMEFSATAMGANGEPDEAAEEVFAIACKEVNRDWSGFGKDVKVKKKRPEYRGGQHFGNNEDSDSDAESDDDAEAKALAIGGLRLTDVRAGSFERDTIIFNPFPGSALSS